ncbi:hypothetical protein [Nioella sp. MMSF_3534]|uniref:hypothetical protein n=1 Tax=Nioella sp. MMSF_3534 TaxID=3046720 RepID=UPI00273D3792|nr:hypothetical protein [Nioella sp. MMSF_3534]
MRFALLLVAALAACTPLPLPTAAPDGNGVTPDSDGLQPGGTDLRIDFGRAQEGVIDTVSRLLGTDPLDITTSPDCGDVTAAYWRNGLTLNFVEGDFRGWVLTEPGLTAAGGLSVGDTPPPVTMATTTLGREFEIDGVWALVEETGPEITTVWSGRTCFFR